MQLSSWGPDVAEKGISSKSPLMESFGQRLITFSLGFVQSNMLTKSQIHLTGIGFKMPHNFARTFILGTPPQPKSAITDSDLDQDQPRSPRSKTRQVHDAVFFMYTDQALDTVMCSFLYGVHRLQPGSESQQYVRHMLPTATRSSTAAMLMIMTTHIAILSIMTTRGLPSSIPRPVTRC